MSGKDQGLARLGDIIDIDVDPRDDTIDQLERQVAKLRGELSDTRHELARVREDSNRALTALRAQLSPLYRALQRVFGELDDAGIRDDGPTSGGAAPVGAPSDGPDARQRGVWDPWKAKLTPACAKLIDALLTHGSLNPTQIKVAARLGTSTVSESITKMNKLGLLERVDGKYALKKL